MKHASYLAITATLAALVSVPGGLGALQQPSSLMLQPSAVSEEGRTWISGVRELADGRVVVVDRNEFVVYLYSRDLTEISTIGAEGEGPGEYKAPHELIWLPGDSTLLVDRGQGRLLLLGPGGRPTDRVYRPDQIGDPSFLGSSAFRAPTVDRAGRWYGEGAAFTGYLSERRVFDSIAIVRRDGLFSEIGDTVAHVSNVEGWEGVPSYEPAADWAVCGNGLVYIASPAPYRVTTVASDRTRTTGPVIEYRPVRVTDRVIDRWKHLESMSYSVAGMQSRDGGSTAYMFTPINPDNLDKWDWWPDALPPFGTGSVRCGPHDRLWVERITEPGSPPLVDVFDSGGNRLRQFELPDGARIVGFGERSVYAVRTDEFALQYLMRIPVPN